MGGDEFLLVIKHLTDHARLMSLSTALIRGIEEPQDYDGTPCQISAKAYCVLFESNWGSQAHLCLIHFCLEVDHEQTLLFGPSGTDLRLHR